MIPELRSPIQDVPKLGETKVVDAMKEATACFFGAVFVFFIWDIMMRVVTSLEGQKGRLKK